MRCAWLSRARKELSALFSKVIQARRASGAQENDVLQVFSVFTNTIICIYDVWASHLLLFALFNIADRELHVGQDFNPNHLMAVSEPC